MLTETSTALKKQEKPLSALESEREHLDMVSITHPMWNVYLKFDMYVVDALISMLIFINDIDKNDVYFNKVTKDLIRVLSGGHAPIIHTEIHPFLLWSSTVVRNLTTAEPHQLYRRLGRPLLRS